MAAVTSLIIAGLGLAAAGTFVQYNAAQRSASAQQDIARQELAIEAERKKAMELDARRKQLEVLRNQQRANALALSGATNQGAQFGSGLAGGYGQVQGQATTNAVGISQNREIGENIFGYNSNISQDRINLAAFGSQAAFGSGLSSFGSSLVGAGSSMYRLGNFGSGWWGSGNPYGPPGETPWG